MRFTLNLLPFKAMLSNLRECGRHQFCGLSPDVEVPTPCLLHAATESMQWL